MSGTGQTWCETNAAGWRDTDHAHSQRTVSSWPEYIAENTPRLGRAEQTADQATAACVAPGTPQVSATRGRKKQKSAPGMRKY